MKSFDNWYRLQGTVSEPITKTAPDDKFVEGWNAAIAQAIKDVEYGMANFDRKHDGSMITAFESVIETVQELTPMTAEDIAKLSEQS